MPDSHSNAEKPAASGPGAGYGLPNKAAPLPRQWQLPRQAPAPVSHEGAGHFYLGPAGAGDWQQAAPPRRMERAMLLGLWLLVMLAAITIGLRLLDLNAPAVDRREPVRPIASADAANAMRSAAVAGSSSKEDDPFDDPVEDPVPASLRDLLPARPAAPIPPSVPTPASLPLPRPAATDAPLRRTSRLSSASTLAIDQSAETAPGRASARPACAEALQAMQLCPDTR